MALDSASQSAPQWTRCRNRGWLASFEEVGGPCVIGGNDVVLCRVRQGVEDRHFMPALRSSPAR